mmetsp:Transcript_75392/g.233205  ORF Transcript_75392/g.233205 Transcript_75392/m.233205 type:complete len:242 (+) Transcript_75392:95-820(+)|eukprot:CAMPEP_0204561490 /NCGR_PEP_ID=MMETSP0661-20131031/33211_1 /ASSEMBLY_ACC=CAM_ASM_000606 /TAXON_ID=109239 /ORGANISM="Alexandrium margalefi, Strain AMGDE01CS-322" /LENGTH=241 /DNA_ID=CAMNT_0051568907 /DNA_START=95 /DNA_END=820 /DNA_ORIENTATION=+
MGRPEMGIEHRIVNDRSKRPPATVTISSDGLSAEVAIEGGSTIEVPIDPVLGPKTIQFDGTMKAMCYDDKAMHCKWGVPWKNRIPTQKKVLIITAMERTVRMQERMKAKGRLDPRIPDFLEGMLGASAGWTPYSEAEQNAAISGIAGKAWDWDDDVEEEEAPKQEAAKVAAAREDGASTMQQPLWALASWGWMPDPSTFREAARAGGQPAAGAPAKAKAKAEPTKPTAKPKSRFSPNIKKS